MRTRIMSGAVIVAALLGAVWFSSWIWAGVVLVVSILANQELQALFEAKGYRHAYRLSTLFGAGIIAAAFVLVRPFDTTDPVLWREVIHPRLMAGEVLVLALAVISAFVIFLFSYQPRATIGDISTTILGIIYLGWLPSFILLIRFLPAGRQWALWVLLTIAMSDIAAYFCGRLFGKTPFFPAISPKKTLEGAVGGLLVTVGFSSVIAHLVEVDWYHGAVLGLILGLGGQLGDLAESLLKRDAGKKDSGEVIPGHGGFLDRIDSYLFTGVLAYHYLVLVLL